jgi:large subunit ribosomal protein L23
MAANPRDIIIRPIVTEKTSDMMEKENKYTFQVAMGANKTEIRQAIEAIFNVKVVNVNTVRVEGKTKRMGKYEGKRSDYKKAVVKLAEGNTIALFEGM